MSGFQLASSNPLAPCGFDAAFLPPGAVARTPGLPEDSRSRSVRLLAALAPQRLLRLFPRLPHYSVSYMRLEICISIIV